MLGSEERRKFLSDLVLFPLLSSPSLGIGFKARKDRDRGELVSSERLELRRNTNRVRVELLRFLSAQPQSQYLAL